MLLITTAIKFSTIIVYQGLPGGSVSKESICNAGDPGLIPESKNTQEKKMATHFTVLAWRTPLTEEPGGLQFMGSQESDMTEQLNHFHHHCVPGTFQCSPHISTISCNAHSKPMK